MINGLYRQSNRRERGQSIVLIALVFFGLIAFVGLTVDMGTMLISLGHLRRSVDAAALGAAVQYREGYNATDLNHAAIEFLRLNGIDLNNLSATVEVCDDAHLSDTQLCTTPRRKLVRVTANVYVPFSFLPIIGFQGTTITASSIGEAASMDVVLVIDISESMTSDAPLGDPKQDPSYCNPFNTCQPFASVKNAADGFANWVLAKPAADEEDRLSVVIFSDGWEQATSDPNNPNNLSYPGIYRGTHVLGTGWMNDNATALNIIDHMQVYQGPDCADNVGLPGPCRQYSQTIPPIFEGIFCPWGDAPVPGKETQFPFGDASTCTTTNIGGGLRTAAAMFSDNPRLNALWIVVLLTDGAANATDLKDTDHVISGNLQSVKDSLPLGYCPDPTNHTIPYCRDGSVATRHGSSNHTQYDATDYAQDMADALGCAPQNPAATCSQPGQGALVFTIGLGQAVQTRSPIDNIPVGDALLRYIAAVGDDGNPATDPCRTVPYITLTPGHDDSYSCGNYYFAEYGGSLQHIFDDISSRIFTRIAH